MLTLLVKAVVLAAALHHPAAAHTVVKPGDTLSRIAVAHCAKANDWTGIYHANRKVVGGNPNLIYPGQRLVIACTDPPALLRLAATPTAPVAQAGDGDHDGDDPSTGTVNPGGTDRSAPAATGTYGHPYRCGDGDGDGWDMPCGAQQPAAAPAAHSAPAQQAGFSGAPGSFQACVIARESGGNPSAVNPSSGAGGLFQFLPSTWAALGFPGLPENASVAMQNAAFQKEYAQSGTSAWAPYDGC